MSNPRPNRHQWTSLDAVPLAILGPELVMAAGLFAVGTVFILTVYWAVVAVVLWRIALWVAVLVNTTGATVAVVRLAGGTNPPGALRHVLGLAGNIAILGASLWALTQLGWWWCWWWWWWW